MSATLSDFVTRREAAMIIGVSPQRIDDYIKNGKLLNVGQGGRYGHPLLIRAECEQLARHRRSLPTTKTSRDSSGAARPKGGRPKGTTGIPWKNRKRSLK